MKWLNDLLRGITPSPPAVEDQLEGARQERVEAQQSYIEARRLASQIRQVSIKSHRIRSENQFSDRLAQTFGSRPQGG